MWTPGVSLLHALGRWLLVPKTLVSFVSTAIEFNQTYVVSVTVYPATNIYNTSEIRNSLTRGTGLQVIIESFVGFIIGGLTIFFTACIIIFLGANEKLCTDCIEEESPRLSLKS